MLTSLKYMLSTLFIFSTGNMAVGADSIELPVWPGREPGNGSKDEKVTERGKPDHPNRSVTNVTWPELFVYLAPPDKACGAAVIICPGGGYGGLAIDKEGHDVARWLNTLGVTGVVLKYRMPRPEISKTEKPYPLQDVQQAIRLVRSHCDEWKLDASRIGVMGFSAGGHLASTAATHFDSGKPDAPDAIERQSCRPDFAMLCYPVISFKDPVAHAGSRNAFLGKSPSPEMLDLYSNELQVTAQTPPAFLVHAQDDGVKIANSIQFYEALKKAGVACEFQKYEKGGHGYGLGVNGGEVAEWPKRAAEWLEKQHILRRN